MKKTIISLALVLLTLNELSAQITSYRLNFRYRISRNKLAALNADSFQIKDANGVRYQFCESLRKPFKCLINNKDGDLFIDPWAITDSTLNPQTSKADPCLGSTDTINAQTPNNLRIDGLKRTYVGNPTKSITLPYQTIIVGVNYIGFKIRPKVRDYNDSLYSSNVVAGNINLGFSFGYSFGWTKFTHRSSHSWSITPGISLGLGAVSLGKEPLKKQVSTTYTPNNFVLSPCASITIARNDIGLIFTYGHDVMFGRHASAWAYQGKGFFGFGIAAGLKL
jgi:hypothetical protein